MSTSFFYCDTSAWALVEYVLYCHILWWISYYFLLLVTKQSEEWCCRILTFVHGCLISYSSIKDIVMNKNPIDFTCIPLSPQKKTYLSYMLSYFLFDFCWIHFFGNETWVIYAHHAASIMIITNVLVKNYGGTGISYGIAGLELTNPYLQLRWFLRTHGYIDKPIHTITELWFMFLFFVFRVIGGTILLYYALMRSSTDWGIKISCLCIYGISLVLQWQIAVFFKKKYLSIRSLRNVTFMNSRISISPYFQRRTLDIPYANTYEPEGTAGKANSSIVLAVPPIVISLASSLKEFPTSAIGSGVSKSETAKEVEPKEKTEEEAPGHSTTEPPTAEPPTAEPPTAEAPTAEPPEETPEEKQDDTENGS